MSSVITTRAVLAFGLRRAIMWPMDFLLDRPPWFVVGPLIGVCLVGLLALVNRRLGVLGGFSAVVERATGRTDALGWRGAFLLGVIGGGLLFSLLAGSFGSGGGYGWLSRSVDGALVGPILVVAGVLIGYGAKTAGGCTSGNGLSGTSLGSPASFVAFASFMATAVGVSLLTEALL
jgi:uncharacterized membrane protein YedE/YeeE